MQRLLALTVANIKSLIRDRVGLFWTFFFPVIFVLLFGSIFSGSGNTRFSVGWVDQDGTSMTEGLRQAMSGIGIFDLTTGSLDDEKAAMQKGDVSAVIVVPKGFTAATAAKSPIAFDVYTDPSKQQTGQIVQQAVQQMANAVNLAAVGAQPFVTIQLQTLQSTQISNVAYLVPSILAMAIMQLGVFAAIPLVEQRQKGILKRLGATPLPRSTLVLSNILVRLIVALVQTVIILGIGAAFFKVTIIGNPLIIAGLVLLGASTFLSLGYLMAAFAKTEEAGQGLVQVVQIPMMFLSGIFFPFEILPGFLKTIARIMPLTYLGDAMRQIMVNGTAFAPLWMDVAILCAWAVVCLGITARYFRWE